MERSEVSDSPTSEIPVGDDVWVHSTCEMCYTATACGILVHRVNGVVVKIEGDPECPHNAGKMCAKGQAAIMTLYDPNRVKTPLRRTNPEKGIGVDPKWEAISWEEGLDIVCERLKKIREDDPRKLVFQNWDIGFHRIFDYWQRAFGNERSGSLTGGRCAAGLHAATYTINGSFHNDIDLNYCNYCILWGAQMGFLAGISPLPMARKMAEARARGMKLVVIDPMCNQAAAKADEWIPIRPGTDGAMALAMLHVLLNEQGLYDREFIKKHTNGCYLIAPDGSYARDKETNKPLVWDSVEAKAKTFDAEVKDCALEALEGSYLVNGVECYPAFQLLKEQVKKYTPEQVSPITTVPAATIRRIAQEFGEAARIGSKIAIEGKEIPYRPAGIIYYRGIISRQQATMQSLSILLLNFVVGSFYSVGGYGGTNPTGPARSWQFGPAGSWVPRENPDGLLVPAERVSPFDPYAPREGESPLSGVANLLVHAQGSGFAGSSAMVNPEKYEVRVRPEAAILCRRNVAMSGENLDTITKALLSIPFIVCFATVLDETAEFADIVFPETTCMERLISFPNSAMQVGMAPVTGYFYWGVAQSVVEPAGEARQWVKVLLEIADRVGFLKDFYRGVNLTIADPAYQLDLNKKYSLEEIIDRAIKSDFGAEYGLEWFKEHGYLRVKRTLEEQYPILNFKPRIPIYYEHFHRAGGEVKAVLKEHNITWWDTSDYVALPHWQPRPAYERRQATEYDLFCINYTDPLSWKSISPNNAWLSELHERNPRLLKIQINTEAAKKRGIKDGDPIWVESIVGKVKGTAKVTECIHPEVVGIAGNFGSWAKGKPIARGKGVHYNSLLPVSEDRMDGVSGALEDLVEVKVYKVEE